MEVRITRDPLDPAALLDGVGDAGDGAAVLFVGRTRDHNDGRRVTGLAYDAYVPMAERELGEIAAEAVARFGTPHLVVAHRIGEVAIGEASVAIVVASAHRAQSFEAARYLIEEIKRRLPVWKSERYADGENRWLDGRRPETPTTAGEGGGLA